MDLVFSDQAWDDYLYWQDADARLLARINELIKDITRHPYSGIGKPEPLKHEFRGYWSRRIDNEHRIIYRRVGDQVRIAQLRYHYRP